MPHQICTRIDPISLNQNQHKISVIAQIKQLSSYQISINNLFMKNIITGLLTQMQPTEPVRIIPSLVVFRFSSCIITFSQTSGSTVCTISEVISSRRKKLQFCEISFFISRQLHSLLLLNGLDLSFRLQNSHFCTLQ